MRPKMSDQFTVYEYDICGYFTGNTMEVSWNGGYPGAPARWTNVQMPEVPAGMYARFDLVQWTITDQAPVYPEPEPDPVVEEPPPPPYAHGEAPTVS